MSTSQKKDDMVMKLQRQRGHQGWRIQQHWRNPALFILSNYTWLGHGNTYGWRALRDARGEVRIFTTPEQAYDALVAWKKKFADLYNQSDLE